MNERVGINRGWSMGGIAAATAMALHEVVVATDKYKPIMVAAPGAYLAGRFVGGRVRRSGEDLDHVRHVARIAGWMGGFATVAAVEAGRWYAGIKTGAEMPSFFGQVGETALVAAVATVPTAIGAELSVLAYTGADPEGATTAPQSVVTPTLASPVHAAAQPARMPSSAPRSVMGQLPPTHYRR